MDEWKKANPIEPGTVAVVVDHIDHIVGVAGIDAAGLGSDFDGSTRRRSGSRTCRAIRGSRRRC
jgi:microsomal dipeptidase-like Zn-dependent dipeptidase